MSWLKNLFKKAKEKVKKPLVVITMIVGYYNGDCPKCKTHIGTDISKNTLTGKMTAYCGHCGQNVYDKLDKSKIMYK